jgi:hypothetical protein
VRIVVRASDHEEELGEREIGGNRRAVGVPVPVTLAAAAATHDSRAIGFSWGGLYDAVQYRANLATSNLIK